MINPAKIFERERLHQRMIHAIVEVMAGTLVIFALGCLWRPGEEWGNLLRGFFVCAALSVFRWVVRIAQHPAPQSAGEPFVPDFGNTTVPPEWHLLREMMVPSSDAGEGDRVLLKRLTAELSDGYRHRRMRLIVPVAFSLIVLAVARPDMRGLFSQMSAAIAFWRPYAEIVVHKGLADDAEIKGAPDRHVIPVYRFKRPHVRLLEGNLVEVLMAGSVQDAPVLQLREAGQDFLMATSSSPESLGRFAITVTVSRSTDMHVVTGGTSVKLASIEVMSLPLPRVSLAAPSLAATRNDGIKAGPFGEAWQDDKPLPLQIGVSAENPVASVKLIIKSGRQESVENVLNVLSEDKRRIDTSYNLVLEPYIESDEAEVILVAIATDRAVPKPLTGASEPLKLQVLSSYGRYRRTLQTLKEVKSLLDDATQNGGTAMKEFKEKAPALAATAMEQSAESPYFDALDRNDLQSIVNEVQSASGAGLVDLSAQLNDFLFSHESIDQRERDRDFFVAMRTLSRILQQSQAATQVPRIVDRVQSFLDERHKFWAARVQRLDQGLAPRQWPEIRDQKPFHRGLREVGDMTERNASQQALTKVTQIVSRYRSWIDELEAKEDETRKRRESERQRGLASAENELRELQRRQGEISSGLDRAQSRDASEIAKNWPGLRGSQNGNIKGTRSLEGKLRAFSPGAEARIKAAIEQMESTVQRGNSNDFTAAESSSDMAGRLLRQAEQAAQQSRDSSGDRGRRRRVSGDNYYGQSIVGGDIEIKREYQVDRKYREDILDEVSRARSVEDDKMLLDRYTREVVR